MADEMSKDMAAMAAIYLSHTEDMIEDPGTTELPVMRRRQLAASILERAESGDRLSGLCGLISEQADLLQERGRLADEYTRLSMLSRALVSAVERGVDLSEPLAELQAVLNG